MRPSRGGFLPWRFGPWGGGGGPSVGPGGLGGGGGGGAVFVAGRLEPSRAERASSLAPGGLRGGGARAHRMSPEWSLRGTSSAAAAAPIAEEDQRVCRR